MIFAMHRRALRALGVLLLPVVLSGCNIAAGAADIASPVGQAGAPRKEGKFQ